jgi:transcription elongation factor Elf1
MIALSCPSCGTPTRLDRADNTLRGKFKAKQALSCGICGMKYQLVDNIEPFRAATASGLDLVEYFVDEG